LALFAARTGLQSIFRLTGTMNALRHRLFLAAERTSWTLGVAGLRLGVFHVWTATRRETISSASERSGCRRQDTSTNPCVAGALRLAALIGPAPAPPRWFESPDSTRGAVCPAPTTARRAPWVIDDTALPRADGNSGIAGHRDGFSGSRTSFRVTDRAQTLKEIYRVDRTWVVNPEDVTVLDPTAARSLTLVTCYPFYYVGAAPQRFIVRAVLAGDRSVGVLPVGPRSPVS
jgi:LPXTG-site transpeptidase (sortase) family protein